jgi:predicted aspartyl protease
MRVSSILGFLALAVLSQNRMALAADCGPLKMVNTVQLQREGNGIRDLIPLQINGTDELFLFDSGGVTTMIGRKTADDLKLSIRQGSMEFYDVTGNISRDQASVSEFTLGHMKGKDFAFPVTPMSSHGGIFSLNFMLPYDVDVDFGNDKLNFFDKDHCPGGVLYWKASAVAVLPITIREGHMTVPVTLDGQTFTAVIDTGASYSTLRMDIAQRSYKLEMGTPETQEAGLLNGDSSLKTYGHVFKSLSFGDINVSNPHLTIIPDAVNRNGDRSEQTGNRARLVRDDIVGPEMLIGMNVLRHLHVYMAFGERKMYISPASSASAPQAAAPAQ